MSAASVQWDSDPMDFIEDVKTDVKKMVERTVIQVFGGVVHRTPVRSGGLRASWRIVTSSAGDFESYVKGGSVGAPLEAPTIPTSIEGLSDFPVVHVVNCAPHAEVVENGGPRNIPHHMMALTLVDVGA